MALTANGLRVGRAGASDLADMCEYIQQAQEEATKEFTEKWLDAVDSLVGLLGNDFDAWWDSYPSTMSKREFLPFMLAKIEEIQSQTHPVDHAQDIEREIDKALRVNAEWVAEMTADHDEWKDWDSTRESDRPQ